MKIRLILILVVTVTLTNVSLGQNKLMDRKISESFEKFVSKSRKSDGDYSTISLANWRRDLDVPSLSSDDMIRRVLDTFETYYKNLEIIDYLIVYDEKPGKGLVYDFIIIHHKTKPAKTYQFATKKPVVEK